MELGMRPQYQVAALSSLPAMILSWLRTKLPLHDSGKFSSARPLRTVRLDYRFRPHILDPVSVTEYFTFPELVFNVGYK